jgi:hypothetical protein
MQFIAVFNGVDANSEPKVISGVIGIEAGDKIVNAVNLTSDAGVNLASVGIGIQKVVQLGGDLTGQRILILVERP